MPYDLLTDLVFRPGTKKDAVMIPLLTIAGITHAISLGPDSRNMAESFNFDSSDLTKRQSVFLKENNFAPFETSFISGVPQPGEPKLIDITKLNMTGQPLSIPAEGMFTTLNNTPLIHKPADCPTAIIFALSKSGQRVLGLIHLGRPQVNSNVTERSLEHLEKNYDVDLTDITIGISPSIGPDYYFIKKKDQEERQLLDLAYWGKYAWPDTLEQTPILRIDVLGKILSILSSYSVPDHNIQAYGHIDRVDTYVLAGKNPPEAFSHRYAVSTNQPEKNGRILVAAQL